MQGMCVCVCVCVCVAPRVNHYESMARGESVYLSVLSQIAAVVLLGVHVKCTCIGWIKSMLAPN